MKKGKKKLFSSSITFYQLTPSSLHCILSPTPFAVKLFRATSAARLIKFSFLQITIREARRATESHRHYELQDCLSAVMQRGEVSERKQRRHKWLHYTIIISLCRVVIFTCCKPLSVNTANSPTVTPHKHLSAQVQITRWKTRRGAEET